MSSPAWTAALADAVLVLHFGVVLFVVGGLLLIVLGNLMAWPWVNRLWFRVAHLAAIGVVLAESWLGIDCPLTTLESWLRQETAVSVYANSSFMQTWLHQLMFFEGPVWVFTLAYTVFAGLVLAAWLVYPPKR